jgi:hypothetical protein
MAQSGSADRARSQWRWTDRERLPRADAREGPMLLLLLLVLQGITIGRNECSGHGLRDGTARTGMINPKRKTGKRASRMRVRTGRPSFFMLLFPSLPSSLDTPHCHPALPVSRGSNERSAFPTPSGRRRGSQLVPKVRIGGASARRGLRGSSCRLHLPSGGNSQVCEETLADGDTR